MASLPRLESQSNVGSDDSIDPSHHASSNYISIGLIIRHKVCAIIRQRLGGLFNSNIQDSQSDLPQYIEKGLDKYPRGYPHLAAITALDKDYLILRQFDYLHARTLLNLQRRLQEYERKLEDLDSESHREGSSTEDNNSRQWFDRDRVMKDIESTLKRYREMMNYVCRPDLQGKPSETSMRKLEYYCKYYKPISDEAMKYYLYRGDLVSLRGLEDTARVDGLFERLFFDDPSELVQKILRDDEGTRQNPDFIVLSRKEFRAIREAILISILIIVLVFPIYPLYRMCQGEMTALTIVGIMFIQFGSTCIFTCCLNYMTRPKRQELFAYSAGYLAVLTAFMSQTLQSSKG
ncbi:hypothetical protein F4811DRAFT_456753 [Daldinia bambusicola]|nr:hypothetical protein F4811DRAFT_456753 [Daldinia bambusicola]